MPRMLQPGQIERQKYGIEEIPRGIRGMPFVYVFIPAITG